ncbi:hydrogenase expression/formation protein HypE [Streptomyces sulfonofaciens]|uniref:Hydrogenase expression/formation protein HypE n=1 Tax=Streptomyces sulfonofaciens TaxID=68272 RepID=A0A919L8P0_9ACTN|nr:hydrogenase expression/formation protein HypE [Streptomyces sulfonofaciens]GHH86786.1 hydrogenase expression/formation protein HypE [Streptomyces sulfonofaciens]
MADTVLDPSAWTCPAPLREQGVVVMGHGGGGALSAELMEHLFAPAYGNDVLADLADSAAVELGGTRLALSTDSYVVRPLFFPGGCIGDLAVNGTVNDLAMSGARAAFLSCAFILEEGTELEVVGRIAQAIGAAARAAGVTVVTGDTKVVDSGHGDGVYVTTSGIGLIPRGVDIRPQRAAPGDVVLVSGPVGMHGIAILSVRESLEFGADVTSDTAPLGGLVSSMLEVAGDLHALRDPTRGGLATTLNEIAAAAGCGIVIDEHRVPVPEPVANACGFLGLDPLYVANEGRLVACVPAADAEAVLAAMRAHPCGTAATAIGACVADHPGGVLARSRFGGTRVVDLPVGEQLPRIC